MNRPKRTFTKEERKSIQDDIKYYRLKRLASMEESDWQDVDYCEQQIDMMEEDLK